MRRIYCEQHSASLQVRKVANRATLLHCMLDQKVGNQLTKLALNDVIAGEGDAASTGLGETSLVDKISDTLQVGVAPGNVWLTDAQHVQGSLKNKLILSTQNINKQATTVCCPSDLQGEQNLDLNHSSHS